jgi:hypothetical protein
MNCQMPELVGSDVKFLHTGAYNDRPDYPTGMLCTFSPSLSLQTTGYVARFLRTPVLPWNL